MRIFRWLIGLLLAAVTVAFAVSNRTPLPLDLWPFPLTIEAPAYLVAFASLVAGVVLGGVATWFSAGSVRAKLRRAERQVTNLEREITILKSQVPDETEDPPDKKMIAAE